ncbi:anaerobic ribonucleoside-triphosphate reductase activating protein [Gorillibacterium massiliense]|uniref:anaerobic ribonucleoside-triphosphate reductase activating protein n=1 Tax=Gorillibacterium massiliense TaxID=1280390 RepID=UPI00192E4F2F|nr:anaerobic ribonucleoside-triphosphate reductase activating protein [Gorillibacterium massiliense]
MRVSGIVKDSIVDGPGLRLTVFAQGCPHRCKGCHNPQTHPFEGGGAVEVKQILEELERNPLLDGITLSGGEPFSQAPGFAKLAEAAKARGLHVMTYTGYTYEEIAEGSLKRKDWHKLLSYTDVLVDGRFEWERRSLSLRFRGSTNQRLIDVASTQQQGEVVLWEQ